jgi:hypothetical protein
VTHISYAYLNVLILALRLHSAAAYTLAYLFASPIQHESTHITPQADGRAFQLWLYSIIPAE